LSATELVIFGQRFGQRLQQVYDAVVSESEYTVSFKQDAQGELPQRVRGQHILNKKLGHIITLKPSFEEFDVAHELCHALMLAKGFPEAGSSKPYQGEEKTVDIGIALKHSMSHQEVNRFLEEFSYQDELSTYYWVKNLDIAGGVNASFRALGVYESLLYSLDILELMLARKLDNAARNALATNAPRLLVVATDLSSLLTPHSINGPRGFRNGYLAAVRWLDDYIRQNAEQSNLGQTLLIDPILSPSERDAPASQVFVLEIVRDGGNDLTVLVKYLPDAGYCYSLEMKEAELGEWEHCLATNSSAAFLVSVESGVPH